MEEEKTVYAKHSTFKQRNVYLKKLLERTIVTGVPQIVTERNIKRKLFKIVVLLSCLGGFSYQILTFLALYFRYPTSLEVLVQFRETQQLPKPIATICNINGIRRSHYCKENRQKCTLPYNKTRVCFKNPHLCDKDNLTDEDMWFPYQEVYRTMDYDRDNVMKYGIRFKDVLTPNYRNITTDMILMNENMKLRRCYAVDIGLVKEYADESDLLHDSLRLHGDEINTIADLVVRTQPEEIFRPAIPIGMKVAVHSNEEIVNPFIKGFFVQPGFRYMVRLKAIEHDLLASPYATNCTHYENRWDEDIESKDSTDICIVRCKKKNWLEKCGCISATYPLETDERLCTESTEYNCISRFDVDTCYNECPIACKSTVFETQVDKVPIETILPQENITLSGYDETYHLRRRISVLNFFFDRPEVFIYKYKPKFQPIELFGYIGGYIGIWLGMSFIALFDFLEIIATFLYHVVRGMVPLKR